MLRSKSQFQWYVAAAALTLLCKAHVAVGQPAAESATEASSAAEPGEPAAPSVIPATGEPSSFSFRLQDQDAQPAPAEEPAPPEAPEGSKNAGFWIFNRSPDPGPLVTDRPGFSDSTVLVPRGFVQLEGGYTFLYDREGPSRTKSHTLGELSLRTGLTDNFELRIKWSGYSFTEVLNEDTSRWSERQVNREDHDDGCLDMSVGFKSQLLKQDGLVPNLSIIPAISIPTGKDSKSTGDVDPEVRLAWNYQLNDKWSVYGVGLATSLSDSSGRFFQAGASLATYYQFTPMLGGFLEYYGLYPSTRDTDCQHNVDFGPVILLSENLQIDIRAGLGLNEEAPDYFGGIGFSYRF